ncbi:hypothetical protein Btru_037753 [Bulinus truncatus]|nr:hypothetical protein Btru_037753 [Bulinus truncatus]
MSFTGLPLVVCYIVIYAHQSGQKTLEYYDAPTPKPLYIGSVFYRIVIYYQPDSRAVNELLHGMDDDSTFKLVHRSNFDYVESMRSDQGVLFQVDSGQSVPKNLKFLTVTKYSYKTDEIYGDTFSHFNNLLTQLVVTKIFINYWQKKAGLTNPPPNETFSLMTMPEPTPITFRREAVLLMIKSLFVLLYFGLAAITAQSIVQEKESRIKESMKLLELQTLIRMFVCLSLPQESMKLMELQNLNRMFVFLSLPLESMKLMELQNLTRMFVCLSLPQESMELMGLQTFSFWFTWFITSFVFGFSPCIIFTVAFCILTYENGQILYSDPVFIAAVFTLYSVNIISFCCMMSCFISKGRNAAIGVGTLYFLLMFASPLTFQYLDTRRLAHIGGVLLFQSGIGHFMNMLMDFEKRKVSQTFDHMLTTEVLPYLNLLDCLVMMVTNTVFNWLIVWYMDNVYPGEYGIPQPYNFFLTTTYWCPKFGSAPDLHETPEQDVRYFEQPSDNLTPGIKIRNLVKVGHGCFLPPTKGTAIVNGFDITKNLKEARRNVGLCPQHDILFPSLTCEEHLVFYSKLREQYDRVNTRKEIDKLLEEVDLMEKRKCYSAVLSGGQKRKLSVACSFIGGSQRSEKAVELSEEVTGRTNHTADHSLHGRGRHLGGQDRHHGKGCGTGYQMNIVILPDCDVQEVTETIEKYIPEVKRAHRTNTEIFYLLPEKDVHLYSKMMLELENKRSELKIESFGVVATSLEDMFVRVGEGFEPKSFLDVDNLALSQLVIVQTMNRRNWASSKTGIVIAGHCHIISSLPYVASECLC